MSSATPRFWPPNPGRQLDGPQPEDLLRAAADELGPATDFEVIAELDTRVVGDELEHVFYLLSEKVGYRHVLFRAHHQLGFPITLLDRPGDEGKSVTPFGPPQEAQTECNTSEELEQSLKELFERPDTQRIVSQLRNLSRQAS